MNAIYRVIREELHAPEIGPYTTYGIDAVDGDGQLLAHLSDVSTECSIVEALVVELNRLDLSPLHLMEVVQDHIA